MKDPAYVPMLSWKNVTCCVCLFVLFLSRPWVAEESPCLSFWAKLKALQCWRRLSTKRMHVHRKVVLDTCRSRVDRKHPLKFPASEMGSLEGTLESRGTWSYLSFENKKNIYNFYDIYLMCMHMYDICVCARVCRHVVMWQLEDSFLGLASLSITWVLEIKLRSSGLAAIPFTGWATTLAPQRLEMWPRKGGDTSGLSPFSFFVTPGPEAVTLLHLIATSQKAWNNGLFAHWLCFLTCKQEIDLSPT